MFRLKIITALIHINELLIFYPRLRRFYLSVIKRDDPVIIDVGSNKGQTIDFFLKNFSKAKIYGFEPNRELYLQLVKKYAGNKNIVITNCGISNQAGKLMFNETITNETSTFEELNYDSDYLKMKSKVLGVKPENIIKSSYEVEVTTLSDFLSKNGIKEIDVLKIDTEGHEYKCLLGYFDKASVKARFIQLEQHHNDMHANRASAETITQLLAANKYPLFATIKHGFGDFEEIIYKYNNS